MRFLLLSMLLGAGCTGELIPADGTEATGPDGASGVSEVFRPTIQADLDGAGCMSGSGCHAGTIAPMPLTPAPQSDDEWLANYEAVRSRAGTRTSSLLMDKATGAGGHVALAESDPMLQRWWAWIDRGAPFAEDGPEPDGGAAATDAGLPVDAGPGLTWGGDIDPLLARVGCRDCHGNSGAYSLDSYTAAFGFGTDQVPNIIPGNAQSLLIQYCEQGHEGIVSTDALVVIEWVVDWGAAE